MAADAVGTTSLAERVDFIDEDDGWRLFSGLLEQVAHTGCSDSDEHFDEFGTVDGKERHARFTGDGTCKQSLTGTRGPDEQDAVRDASAETAIGFRVFQKADDFLKFFLGFIDSGYVVEGDLDIFFNVDFGTALADGHEPATAAAHACLIGHTAHQEHPYPEEDGGRDDPAEDIFQKGAFDDACELDVVFGELFGQCVIHTGGREVLFSV